MKDFSKVPPGRQTQCFGDRRKYGLDLDYTEQIFHFGRLPLRHTAPFTWHQGHSHCLLSRTLSTQRLMSQLCGSVQFSPSGVSNSLRPHESQHARPPYPSPTPEVHSDSHPLSQWCHPAISSSVVPFSSCPQCLSSSESFPMSQLLFGMRWPKSWSFSFSIIPSKEIPGLMSFRVDWLDLLAVQGTLKSLLQHHSSKASILQLSAFFTVQLSHPYMTTGKTIALTKWTLVGKAMSLLLNTLSRLVRTFLLRSKRLLISWLQSPSAVIVEPPK